MSDETETQDRPAHERTKGKAGDRELPPPPTPEEWETAAVAGHLMGVVLSARLARYRPGQTIDMRQDIHCLSCGNLYRPDNPNRPENVLICYTCLRDWEEYDPENLA